MNQFKEPVKLQKILGWLIFLGFAVVLPAVILWFASSYVASVTAEAKLRRYQIEANDILERLRISSDSGQHLCSRINDVFVHSGDIRELQAGISNLNFEFDGGLEFVIWNAEGNVATATYAWEQVKADWQQAFVSLLDIAENWRDKIPADQNANLRRIFGPQFFPEMHSSCYSGRNISPLYGDSSMKIRPSWIRASKKFGLAVFLQEKLLQGVRGIEFQMRQMAASSDLKLAVLVDGQLLIDPNVKLLQADIATISQNFINPQKLADWYVFKGVLKTNVFGFCFLPVKKIEALQWSLPWKAILGLLIAIALLIGRQSFKVAFAGQRLSLGIRRQLIILFLVANSLSLVILALLGFDYLHQYRMFLQTETFSKGMTYLQSIDEMFISEFSSQLRRMHKTMEQLKNDLHAKKPARNMIEDLLAAQSPKPFRFFLIGSHTPYIYSEAGVMKDGKFIAEVKLDRSRYQAMQALVESMGKLGSYYLSLLNREILSQAIITQVELIAESLGQLRPIEMFQEFFAATGSFWQWGMGARNYPAFISILSLNDQEVADYVFLYLWDSFYLQQTHIRKVFADMNRNPLGLKIMAVDGDFRYSLPPELLEHKQLRLYSSKLREKTGTEIEYCDWEDEKHLLLGLKCTSLHSVRLLGLFPVAEIDSKVRQKLYLFLAFALISFFVSVALGLFVARSILLPLNELQKGVIALQKRDFAYRLPELGQDEFGDLARIFNTTLVDLEELHTASIVQDKLSEKMLQVYRHGNFSFYAGSRSVQKLGGDYLDFNAGDGHACLSLGDVAGSGVSVSLLIAYIKACLLQLKPLQLQPVALLARLDELIRASGDQSQRTFVAFQHCVISGSSIAVANAGHCFPMIFNPVSGVLRIVEMPSNPLGSGKKPRIFSAGLTLCPQEVLVIYSGGLYRNADIGFDKLREIVMHAYNQCPMQYYANIMDAIFKLVAPTDCTDDLSLIIVADSSTTENTAA